ncbi:uncharacterized protein PAN0_030d6222 [Moesziomyces antarcticus]|uniref:Uncharacterized protein n=2 Tax=Pseudozyma antarctica TaxID=84753 RepID=A0A5C3FRV3_PSEA2|nr:uncharacterized protein PAN0_030d6222 [Moesziomyces antarcticus]GAK67992.1 conserved hypothetical protein [Moesziomyces antarcticus]SPO47168.1 uncharacterized protein PSANT_04855 [Moesziomyces antarcticus]
MATSIAASRSVAPPRELVGVIVVLLSPRTPSDRRRYDALQQLRREHDQAYARWLPHITLIPPFILSSHQPSSTGDIFADLVSSNAQKLDRIKQVAAEVCARYHAHALRLDQVATFPLRAYTNVHLRPTPTNFTDRSTPSRSQSSAGEDTSSRRIVQLQVELKQAVLPVVGSARSRREVWKPHVSVGQAHDPRQTWQLCTAAEDLLSEGGEAALTCDVDSVQLMLKPKRDPGPYHLHYSFPLARE